MRRLLGLSVVLLTVFAAAPAQAAFDPGDDVTYTAGGAARTGVVMVKAGAKDLYLVSRDGAESTQYVVPGSRLALRDRDGDGVPDNRDSCLTQPGTGTNGCPPPADNDGDGITGSADACPTLSGTAPDGCPAPTAAFGFSPASPESGQQVTFDASASGCHSGPCTFSWDDVSGGGVSPLGTGQTLTRTFTSAGTRSVRLITRDAHGRVGTVTHHVTVAAPPPPPPPPPPANAPTLQQVDGGLGYYGQFAHGLPTDPSYFPIGVWGSYNHTQQNLNRDAEAGLNLYVWAADSAFMDEIRADGRFRVIQEQGNRANVGSETAGWVLHDEIDMQQGPGACTTTLQDIKNSLPADGRARYSNYGKGIFPGWETDQQFACFVEAQHLQSDDIYWFTDPNVCTSISEGPSLFRLNRALTQAECRRASNYGAVVDRMQALDARDGVRKPIWNFVEVSHPFSEAPPQSPTITGPQIRAAVWHSLIAGARGIIYFQHSFGIGQPCYGDHHTLRSDCHGNRAAVTAVNAQVKSLAPVLNAPFVTSGHSATGDVKHMVKWSGGKFYVFAGAHNGGGTATFDLPCVGNATAVVEGENRSVPVNGGRFTDSFADGNAIHIYRIDGGTTCGLN